MTGNGRFGWSTTAEEVVAGRRLAGQTVVVTGASSGIGLEAARILASVGADVVLGVRDHDRGDQAATEIARTAQGEVSVRHLDLRDLASVKVFASGVAAPVDVLIANAGVSNTPDSHLANGLEVRFATNHLGHFLLAHLLYPAMAERGARLVVVSSAAHKGNPVRLDDLQWNARPHNWGLAYGASKTANILFACEATRRWGSAGIFANAVLPGSALTGLQRYHGDELKRAIGFVDAEGRPDPMLKTVGQAAATPVWAATAPELAGRGGLVLEDCAEALLVGPDVHKWSGFDPSTVDPDLARALWDRSLELVVDYLPPVQIAD